MKVNTWIGLSRHRKHRTPLLIDETICSEIRSAQRVAVLTGAGVSAESGVPTFRGENGLWRNLTPLELASFEAFSRNSAVVSEWYRHRRAIINEVQPNPGHYALSVMETLYETFNLITQNVDGLHQRAGSRCVIELHGSIMHNYCIRCGKRYSAREFDDMCRLFCDRVPRCICGGLVRPDVVWFGEQLPREAIEKAYYAAVNCEVFFAIGTSAQVRPAADLPYYAKSNGALLIEINPQQTSLTDDADIWLPGQSGRILPQLVDELRRLD